MAASSSSAFTDWPMRLSAPCCSISASHSRRSRQFAGGASVAGEEGRAATAATWSSMMILPHGCTLPKMAGRRTRAFRASARRHGGCHPRSIFWMPLSGACCFTRPRGTHKGASAMSAMSAHANDGEEIRIKALLEAWADAVRRHDLPAILAHHAPDMVMFDLPPPLQCKGIEAYKETWGLMCRYHKPGAGFDIQDLAVTAGQDVAFAVAIMRCGPDSSSNPADKDGFLFRLTVGLRKVEGQWRITHEHHSIPATD